jgi:hypothetical protein
MRNFAYQTTARLPDRLESGSASVSIAGASSALVTLPCSTAGNRLPTADAGSLYVAQTGSPLTLDGTASVDPDGSPLSYTWHFGDGSTAPACSWGHLCRGGRVPGRPDRQDGTDDSMPAIGGRSFVTVRVSDAAPADSTAPISTATTSPEPDGCHHQDVTVTLAATDNAVEAGSKRSDIR